VQWRAHWFGKVQSSGQLLLSVFFAILYLLTPRERSLRFTLTCLRTVLAFLTSLRFRSDEFRKGSKVKFWGASARRGCSPVLD
jgi:hypothetical protein